MALPTVMVASWILALAGAQAADFPTAKLTPHKASQPWGAGELGVANTAETATFELKESWNPTFLVMSGEVLLPATNAALALPDVSATLAKDSRSIAIVIGGGKQAKRFSAAISNDVKTAWLHFEMIRKGGIVNFSVAGAAFFHGVSVKADQSFLVALQNGARVRDVKVTRLPPDMTPVNLDASSTSGAKLREPEHSTAIDLSSLPAGLANVDGVPFLIEDKAVDVRLAMAGADFSRRLKWGYYSVPAGPYRPVSAVNGKSYQALHLLAYSRRLPNHVPEMTLSYGHCVGWSGLMGEVVVPVPDIASGGGSPHVISRLPVKLADGKPGWLYHLRVPVFRNPPAPIAEDTQFEFMREKKDLHNLPDPNEFARVPAGLPSSVVVVSATAEQAPVEFAYVLGAPGNVFHETQEPVLTVRLANRLDGEFKGRLYARSAGPGTPEEGSSLRSEWTVEDSITLKKGEGREFPIKVMPSDRKKRGWFEVEIGVECDGKPVQIFSTTYAVLAPDTRKALADSPFGTWEFWWPHASFTQGDRHVKDAATLINKGGWRWTYGGSPLERARGTTLNAVQLFDDYKITFTIRSLPNSYQRGEGWWDEKVFEESIAPGLREYAKNPAKGQDRAYKVLHESRSSDAMLRRFSVFFGGEPYAMPDKEKATIDAQFINVVKYCQAIKKADPLAKICLINDYPGVGVEFMKRGMPKDAFDMFGTEGAMFMREPERQPDWMCLLGILHEWKRAKAKYGYEDKPIWTTEALYHGTSPANLSLHAQGVYQVREAMLALANGVQRMCAAGCLRDCTDDYRWSNWGQGGFCFHEPVMNPKPNYALYAWLTQILDQATYAGKLEHDSTSLHILDFKTVVGDHVYPVWCVRGRQAVTLTVKGGHPVVLDAYGNRLPATAEGGRLAVSVSDTPVYITGTTVAGVTERKPLEENVDGGKTIVDFDNPGLFAVESSTNRILESNWDFPRIKGDYAVDLVQEDGAGAVKLELKDDQDARKLLQRYVELKLAKPIVLKDTAEAFIARVKGNGGWGRLMFELVDAEGRIWTSCGNQYAGSCNASDNRGDSYVSFDGWSTMIIDLPGRYPATDLTAYRPSTTHWWPENTPEWRQQQADHKKATAEYEKARAEYPAKKKAYDEAKLAYEKKQAEYKQAKAAYDKEQKDYAAALKVYKKSGTDYERAKAKHDKALKDGKEAGAAPVAPQEPAAPVLKAPTVPDGEAPKALKEPTGPGMLRNYGIAPLTYPVKLTKIIFAAAPDILYVTDEIPVKNRAVFIDRIGVRYESREDVSVASK